MSQDFPGLTDTRRHLIVAVIVLATVMQSLDSTIANVALPFMQGSFGASQDQISWVVTSYMVAMAITTAICGWFVERVGRTRLFVLSIAAFTAASMLCAVAQSLPEMVLFRLLQGASAAAVIPLSQALVMSIYPPEKQGTAVAIWGLGTMIAPVLGPTIGGYLTDTLNWRWVFLINIPIGVIAILGVIALFPKNQPQRRNNFNGYGFAYLATAAAALQLVLDRGQTADWFESYEIIIETTVCAVSLYLFVMHMITSPQPFVDRGIFRDRNYVAGIFLAFSFQGVMMSTMVLWPNMLQTLMGYPVITAGLILMPRGIGAMIGMAVIARVIAKYNVRTIILIGLAVSAVSVSLASHFTIDVSSTRLAAVALLQGLGMGLTFVPINTLVFSTLDRRHVDQAAPFYALTRNVGSSIGISIMVTVVSHYTVVNHAVLTEAVNVFNPNIAKMIPSLASQPAAAAAMMEGTIARQAAMMGYCDAFVAMTYATVVLGLLILLVKNARGMGSPQLAHEM